MSTFCNYFMRAGVVKSSEPYNMQVPTYIGLPYARHHTGWGISLRTVGVASKPVQPSPLSFAGFFIYVKRKFVANLKGISLLMWK